VTATLLERPQYGVQEPRVCTRPDWDDGAAGQECIDLATAAGIMLDPWQQFCVRVILAQVHRAEDGQLRWAALRAAILVARQNGKGEILLALELYWLFLAPVDNARLIVHTAHEFKTSSEAFLRLKAVIDGNDWMLRRVRGNPRTSHGEEGYVMTDGRRLRFLARSLASGRGFTGDKVILDEAQQLPTFAMDALMPTMSARNRHGMGVQMVYAGTVPSERMDSEHWRQTMERGRAGTSKRLAWIEYNLSERVPAEAAQNFSHPWWVEAVAAGNPSLGYRHDWDWIEEEQDALSYDGYLRERLNIWSSDPVGMVIPLGTWLSLEETRSRMVGRRAIAVDAPPGLGSAIIVGMGRNQHQQWHAEVVEQHPGTEWVAARVGEVVRRAQDTPGEVALVVIDPASPAGALIADVVKEVGEDLVHRITPQQHAAACGMLYTRAMQAATVEGDDGVPVPLTDPYNPELPARQLVHLGDPIITDALKVAVKRPGPDGAWLWNRRGSESNISPVVAMTLAGYGLSTLPPEADEPWGFYS
jgi:phage terminase large subunit-like protein